VLNPDIAFEVKIGLQKKRKTNKNAPFRKPTKNQKGAQKNEA
jgi:hypothetical protein